MAVTRKDVERLVEGLQAMLKGAVLESCGWRYRISGDRALFDSAEGVAAWVEWEDADIFPGKNLTWSEPRDPFTDPKVGDKFKDKVGDTRTVVGVAPGVGVFVDDSALVSNDPRGFHLNHLECLGWTVKELADG